MNDLLSQLPEHDPRPDLWARIEADLDSDANITGDNAGGVTNGGGGITGIANANGTDGDNDNDSGGHTKDTPNNTTRNATTRQPTARRHMPRATLAGTQSRTARACASLARPHNRARRHACHAPRIGLRRFERPP